MGKNSMELQKMRVDFYGGFTSNAVFLFVGQGMDDEALKKGIAECRFSCVFTTRRDPEFKTLFLADDRKVQELCATDEVLSMTDSRTHLPIVRLFGVSDEKQEKYTPGIMEQIKAVQMLTVLPRLLGNLNQMVVAGYQPENTAEIPVAILADALKLAPQKSVQLWGIDPDNTQYGLLCQVAEQRNFEVFSEQLSEVIYENSEEDESLNYNDVGCSADLFYQNGRVCPLEEDDLLPYGRQASLLTENKVFAVRPNGRILCQKWFSNFLQNDAAESGPMWCGYDTNRMFYVKRRCEEPLVSLVRKLLSDDGTPINNNPVFLVGDPGSSKSITLGALAYRIYCERQNPVIYISKDNMMYHKETDELQRLDSLMQMVEHRGNGTRVLLVWDCSSYRPVMKNVLSMVNILRNRGRRFVLVCSAYSIDGDIKNRKILPASTVGADEVPVAYDKDGYYITTTRALDDKEMYRFKQVVTNYSGIDAVRVRSMFEALEKDNERDIFTLFYQLISLLRPRLRASLSKEQQKVATYVSDKVTALLKKRKENRMNTAMAKLLKDAGWEADESEKSEDDLRQEQALDRFNLCIALFSRFKLNTPAPLAFRMLSDEGDIISPFSSDSRELFQLLVNETTWLYYGEGEEEGDFVFRFRNSLEASIFLENSDLDGVQQLKMICTMLRLCGEDLKNTGFADQRMLGDLLALIKLMGPNSKYPPFVSGQEDYQSIQENLPMLIEALVELRDVYKLPDPAAEIDLCIVTFTRECNVFRHQQKVDETWSDKEKEAHLDDVRRRLASLRDARTRALRCVSELDIRIGETNQQGVREKYAEQQSSLTDEAVLCDTRMQEMVDFCEQLCGGKLPEDINAYRLKAIPYSEIYTMMEKAIQRDPTNGFYYNALFQAFLRMYDRSNLGEKLKLRYLSIIMQVVEDCNHSNVDRRGSRGNDEITLNISKILDRSDKYAVDIDTIRAYEKGDLNAKESNYMKLYEDLREENSAAGIIFVCRKELEKAKISTREEYRLNTTQLMVCKKVRDFMLEKDNFDCFSEDIHYLELLIRVYFMCCNETVLTGQKECQLTQLTAEQWQELRRFCNKYRQLFDAKTGMQKQMPRPLITVLHALCEVQANKGYERAQDLLDSIPEAAFRNTGRMRTLFILCEDGKPKHFTGKAVNIDGDRGNILVDEMPKYLNGRYGVRISRGFKGKNMPMENEVLSDFEIGIGNTSFAAFTPLGSKEARDRW